MKMKEKIYRWFYYRLFRDTPRRADIREYIDNTEPRFKHLKDRCWEVSYSYACGMSIHDIATLANVTRERVRMLLWKFWRLNRDGKWNALVY